MSFSVTGEKLGVISPVKKKYLEDVVFLRLFLIFLLIWNHAFAPYSGHWRPIEGIHDITIYYLLGQIVYYMRIQTLIFISGYLLGYTSKRKSEALRFNSCVIKKVKRLLLPSVIFSIFYFVLFYEFSGALLDAVYKIINGCGHMWFLPMLFWCFVGVWFIEKHHLNPLLILTLALFVSVLPCPTLPLRLNSTLTYFLFFYIGFGLQRGYFDFLKPKQSITPILIAFSVYGLGFVFAEFHLENLVTSIRGGNMLINSTVGVLISKAANSILSLSGLLSSFWCVHYFFRGQFKLPNWTITISTYCYGVYICQQFILIGIYYHSPLPTIIGTTILPWVAIFITLIGSLCFTHMILKTKIGRFLIG